MDYREENKPERAVSGHVAGAPQPTRHRRKRGSGPRWLRRLLRKVGFRLHLGKLLIGFTVVAVVVGVGGLVLVTDATSRINSTLGNLQRVVNSLGTRVQTGLTMDDIDRLQSSLGDVVSTLSTVQRQVRFVRPILGVDADLDASFTAMDALQQLALSGDDLVTGLQPALFFLMGGEERDAAVTQISSGERLVELLRIGRPSFLSAQRRLEDADRLIASVDTANISVGTLLQLEQLRTYHEQIASIQSILMVAPDLLTAALGLDTDRSYLVLSQNSDELRPSGGYISTYGWLTVRRGRIIDYNYSPTTARSPNPPPEPLGTELAIPDWWINYAQPIYAAWDGSWSPDFPTTAGMAMWFYDGGNNPNSPVDGVIAIDIVAFEYILEALGQVELPEYGVVVDTFNFRDVVYDIRAFGEGDLPHKRFLADLYSQIFADWQETASNPDTSSAILSALLRAVQEKHVMLNFGDTNVQDAAALLGWTGAQASASGRDYLMVVDANLGNKSNSSIRRQVIYDVELQPDRSLVSRATVLYDYAASVANEDPAVNQEYHGQLDYNNLLQMFVPPGATRPETTGSLLNEQFIENTAHSQIVGSLRVPFDSSERLQFAYSVPDVVKLFGDFRQYDLLIQKQPGMRAELVNVQITLPEGSQVVSATPEPVATYTIDRQILEFRFEMTSDLEISVVYSE